MTPPPSAMTTSPRSSLAASTPSTTSSRCAKLLVFSPAGSVIDGRLDAALFETGLQRLEMRGGDVVVGDHRSACAGQATRNLDAGARQQARADQDVVGALAKPDLDGDCHVRAHDRTSPSSTAA